MIFDTVDSLVSDLQVKVDKLRKLSEKHINAAEKHDDAAHAAIYRRDGAVAEAGRAKRIADKVAELIS